MSFSTRTVDSSFAPWSVFRAKQYEVATLCFFHTKNMVAAIIESRRVAFEILGHRVDHGIRRQIGFRRRSDHVAIEPQFIRWLTIACRLVVLMPDGNNSAYHNAASVTSTGKNRAKVVNASS